MGIREPDATEIDVLARNLYGGWQDVHTEILLIARAAASDE